MTLGDKMRFWGKQKYGKLKDFADALEIKQPDLTAYLNNEVVPGGNLLRRLHKLGCDINWLLSEDVGTIHEPTATYGDNLYIENQRLKNTLEKLKTILNNLDKEL